MSATVRSTERVGVVRLVGRLLGSRMKAGRRSRGSADDMDQQRSRNQPECSSAAENALGDVETGSDWMTQIQIADAEPDVYVVVERGTADVRRRNYQ